MKRNAKEFFAKELEEDLYVEDIRDQIAVGNRRGLSLAGLPEQVTVIKQEVTSQNAKISSLEQEVTSQKVKISSLQDRVGVR
jgi:hypothetical protein